MSRVPFHGAACLLLLAMAACSPDYPMDRQDTWNLDRYGGSNDANLRAMIADPHDLVVGKGEDASMGAEAAPPVRRLLTGRRAALPATTTLNVNVVGAGGSGSASAGVSSGGQ